jgi:D-3-phosphoglycerate dehydrogenase
VKKILLTGSFGKFSREPFDILEKAGLEPVQIKGQLINTEEKLLSYLDREVAAVINGLEPVGEKVMAAATGLRLIVKHGVGVDNIDLEAARRHGITVANTPGANRNGVADLAFGLMLAAARKIPQADASVKAGEWKGFFGVSVYNRTLGIVGMGAIGKCMALRAKGFSMRILGYDPFWDADFAGKNGVERCELDELLKRSDFVTVHTPLLTSTRGLINGRRLGLMKKSAVLINTARGEIIDEAALCAALKNGDIAASALDAFSDEPLKTDSPLRKLDNIILTPHIAFYNDEAMNATSLYAANIAAQYFSGGAGEGGKKPPWLVLGIQQKNMAAREEKSKNAGSVDF